MSLFFFSSLYIHCIEPLRKAFRDYSKIANSDGSSRHLHILRFSFQLSAKIRIFFELFNFILGFVIILLLGSMITILYDSFEFQNSISLQTILGFDTHFFTWLTSTHLHNFQWTTVSKQPQQCMSSRTNLINSLMF